MQGSFMRRSYNICKGYCFLYGPFCPYRRPPQQARSKKEGTSRCGPLHHVLSRFIRFLWASLVAFSFFRSRSPHLYKLHYLSVMQFGGAESLGMRNRVRGGWVRTVYVQKYCHRNFSELFHCDGKEPPHV